MNNIYIGDEFETFVTDPQTGEKIRGTVENGKLQVTGRVAPLRRSRRCSAEKAASRRLPRPICGEPQTRIEHCSTAELYRQSRKFIG